MWHLFKAEFVYNKRVLSSLFVLSLFSFCVLHYWPNLTGKTPPNTNTGYLYLSHITFYLIFAYLGVPHGKKEKRNYQIIHLPVSVWKFGLLRLGMYFVYWVLLVALFFMYSNVSKYFILDEPTFFTIGSQTGIVFMMLSLVFFWRDLKESFSKKNLSYRKVVGIGIILISLLLGFIAIAGIVHNYQIQDRFGAQTIDIWNWIYQTQAGALIFVLAGLTLALVSTVTFFKRKSYVE